MAPKKQQVSKGQAGASSSRASREENQGGDEFGRGPFQGRQPRRTPEEMEAGEVARWKESMAKRGIRNERHIARLYQPWPANFGAITALQQQGMDYWFEENPGYNKALVLEFYKNMVVPDDILIPGARITSSLGRIDVFMDADKIARVMGYQRPQGGFNFPPTDEFPIDSEMVAEEIYENPRDYKVPHVPGKLTNTYRVLNQVVCFNLFPRGSENKPQEYVGKILWALGQEDTVCDWAMFIFGEMVATRTAIKSSRLPFPCLLTRMFHAEGFRARPFAQMERLDPGTIGADFLARSSAQTRAVPRPLTSPPAKGASTKDWLKKIFCQNVAIMNSHTKLKKESRRIVREQKQINHRLNHLSREISGQATSSSYVPLPLPELEVSDDFAGGYLEEESDDD